MNSKLNILGLSAVILSAALTYDCHKQVQALKIASIATESYEAHVDILLITPGFNETIQAPLEWVNKHQPEVGGYVVVYADGYTSYSPAKAFEEGYAEVRNSGLPPHQQRVVDEKTDLDDKLSKLRAFIDKSPIYESLPTSEQERLGKQEETMAIYSDILGERIEAFTA